jgi:hypothetical protein
MEKHEDDSLNFNITNTTDKIFLMRDFIQNNLLGFKSLREKDFLTSKKAYKKSLMIAQRLADDEIKIVESYTNYGISSYFCGKFIEAKRNLEEAFKVSSKLFNDQKYSELILQ